MTTLLSLFDASLLGRRDQPALEFAARANHDSAADSAPRSPLSNFTFGDLERRSNQLAHVLLARGIRKGDRVAFNMTNCVEIIDLWLACVKLGVIVVPINVLYRDREIFHIVEDAKPRAVITTNRLDAEFRVTIELWDIPELTQHPAYANDVRPTTELTSDTPAALVYTSGTTGTAKGAILTHENFASNARAIVSSWRIVDSDRYLAVLPLFHVHGLGNGVHAWLASGCHMRLAERFEYATATALFEEYRPTLFFGVPTMYVRMLEFDDSVARGIGECARLFVSGSAPLPAHVHGEFQEKFGHTILERYGMTETLMNAGNPYDGERRPGTVGFPFPHVDIRIVNEAGSEVATDELGELLVRGPNVFAGYWNADEATRTAFVDGWFRTGDIGRRSADGYITLEGRRSDLIISAGFNIYPREIEELLLREGDIAEAAVAGMHDPVRGEVPVAFVAFQEPMSDAKFASRAEHLRERLSTQIASFKMPRAFYQVRALPRNAMGKVQKHVLLAGTERVIAGGSVRTSDIRS